MSTWQGRFDKPMSSSMARLSRSLALDIRLMPYEVKVDRVYADALAKAGILSSDELKKIHGALDVMEKEYGTEMANPEKLYDEDVHSFLERRLTVLAGPAGGKIHTGRSRNDLVLTDVRLCLKDECDGLKKLIAELGRALIKKSGEYNEAMMPSYTHVQRAQPIYFAHYLYSFAFTLKDDSERFTSISNGPLSVCPLGSGAVAGTAYDIDRDWIAKKLGFNRVTENSVQAVSNRDEFLELASAIAILMVHLSRYAEDMILWCTREFGFMKIDDTVSTGSSMMPQKKNPDSLELIRGKSARTIGSLTGLFTLLKGLPLSYCRDLQEDKHVLFDMIEEAKLCLEVFAEVISTAKFNADAMRDAVSVDTIATDIADYLVKKGVPFRDAHEVVAGVFRAKPDVATLTFEDFKSASAKFDVDVLKLLNPTEGAKLRRVRGGTAPESIKHQEKVLKEYFK